MADSNTGTSADSLGMTAELLVEALGGDEESSGVDVMSRGELRLGLRHRDSFVVSKAPLAAGVERTSHPQSSLSMALSSLADAANFKLLSAFSDDDTVAEAEEDDDDTASSDGEIDARAVDPKKTARTASPKILKTSMSAASATTETALSDAFNSPILANNEVDKIISSRRPKADLVIKAPSPMSLRLLPPANSSPISLGGALSSLPSAATTAFGFDTIVPSSNPQPDLGVVAHPSPSPSIRSPPKAANKNSQVHIIKESEKNTLPSERPKFMTDAQLAATVRAFEAISLPGAEGDVAPAKQKSRLRTLAKGVASALGLRKSKKRRVADEAAAAFMAEPLRPSPLHPASSLSSLRSPRRESFFCDEREDAPYDYATILDEEGDYTPSHRRHPGRPPSIVTKVSEDGTSRERERFNISFADQHGHELKCIRYSDRLHYSEGSEHVNWSAGPSCVIV